VNQTALNTTGHNIVNADTEGYSRQKINIITTDSEYRSSAYGSVALGTGAEIQSITRARDLFADIQYRDESCTLSYYEAVANNYDKLEVIFNDANNEGVQSQILKFYQTWVSDLSTESSNSANRVAVIEQARNFRDAILTSNQQLKDQIEYNYYFLGVNIDRVNDILQGLTEANKLVVSYESTGAAANDIRDKRDLLVDQLAEYMPVQVHEDEFGNYQVTSGGTTFVSGVDRLHLALSPSIESKYFGVDYGVEDHSIVIKESGVAFLPANGSLKANVEAIETCKSYIKDLANIAGFFLTTFNDQHRQGYDMRGGTKSLTTMVEETARNSSGNIAVDSDGKTHSVFRYVGNTQGSYKCIQDKNGDNLLYTDANGNNIPGAYRCYYVGEGKGDFEVNRVEGTYYYEAATDASGNPNGNFDTDTRLDGTVYYKRVEDGTGHYKISLVETTELPDDVDTVQVPDTINFFGNDNTFYTYSYDADWDTNVVEAVGLDGVKRRLTGSAIIEQLQLNSKLDTPEGYMYLAAATAYDDQNNYS
ncbi:MAG: flagellar hook-associated protein FlgK, partial [Selenomonadaceae bacterium]|nr:flagellar hook-associated protein FlgK [Selenomonadaceae bacterium]